MARSAHEIEEVIRLIPAVSAVRVAMSDAGEIEEVHVLAGSSRHPKQIVRDIETCMAAHYDLRIDRRKISVAQIDEGRSASERRMRLDSVDVRMRGNMVEIRVELAWREKVLEGAASGPATAAHRQRLVSTAALQAVSQALPAHARLLADEVRVFQIAGRPAVAVLVTLSTRSGDERLSGVAYVRRDETEAVARATLAAVNRRIGPLIHEPAEIA